MYRLYLGLSHVQIFQENYVRYCFFGYPMYRLFLENGRQKSKSQYVLNKKNIEHEEGNLKLTKNAPF